MDQQDMFTNIYKGLIQGIGCIQVELIKKNQRKTQRNTKTLILNPKNHLTKWQEKVLKK